MRDREASIHKLVISIRVTTQTTASLSRFSARSVQLSLSLLTMSFSRTKHRYPSGGERCSARYCESYRHLSSYSRVWPHHWFCTMNKHQWSNLTQWLQCYWEGFRFWTWSVTCHDAAYWYYPSNLLFLVVWPASGALQSDNVLDCPSIPAGMSVLLYMWLSMATVQQACLQMRIPIAPIGNNKTAAK